MIAHPATNFFFLAILYGPQNRHRGLLAIYNKVKIPGLHIRPLVGDK